MKDALGIDDTKTIGLTITTCTFTNTSIDSGVANLLIDRSIKLGSDSINKGVISSSIFSSNTLGNLAEGSIKT